MKASGRQQAYNTAHFPQVLSLVCRYIHEFALLAEIRLNIGGEVCPTGGGRGSGIGVRGLYSDIRYLTQMLQITPKKINAPALLRQGQRAMISNSLWYNELAYSHFSGLKS
jgi:hypothetical protein